jgi:hypothetical protein
MINNIDNMNSQDKISPTNKPRAQRFLDDFELGECLTNHDDIKEYVNKEDPQDQYFLDAFTNSVKNCQEKEEEEINHRILKKMFGDLHHNPIKCYHFVNRFFNDVSKKMDMDHPDNEFMRLLEKDFKRKADFSYKNYQDIEEIQRIMDTHIQRFLSLQPHNLIPTEKNLLPLLVTSWTKIDYDVFHPKTAERIKMITHSMFIRDIRNKINTPLTNLTNRIIEYWKTKLTDPEDDWESFERTVNTEEVGIWIITKDRKFIYPKLV